MMVKPVMQEVPIVVLKHLYSCKYMLFGKEGVEGAAEALREEEELTDITMKGQGQSLERGEDGEQKTK